MLKFEPSKFKAPKLSFKDIWQEADKFRQNYWPSEELPINIHDIIDLDLDMEIRCVSRLREITGFDALLLGNLKGIIVDQENYMNDRMENRMRFSFAHEVGHYILHSDVYRNLPYTDEDGWIELIQKKVFGHLPCNLFCTIHNSLAISSAHHSHLHSDLFSILLE